MENSQLGHRQALIQTLNCVSDNCPILLHHLDFYDRVNFPRVPNRRTLQKPKQFTGQRIRRPKTVRGFEPPKYPIKVSNASRSFSPSPVIALLFFLRELPPNRRNTLRPSEYLTIPDP